MSKKHEEIAIDKSMLGWREWIALPDLNIERILAKVDTGAKTCALHTFYIEEFDKDGDSWLRFGVHPEQDSTQIVIHCEAIEKDRREVTDSGGHKEMRYVIEPTLRIGEVEFKAEITLTNRDNMTYRILLGRNALSRRFLVDPSRSYLLKEKSI